ncbi:MAG: hypothetical protein U0903_20375 [Planctomycetales bacterium]
MNIGRTLRDRILARWTLGDRSLFSLCRSGLVGLLFAAALCFPGLRVTGRRFARHAPAQWLVLSALFLGLFTVAALWPLNKVEWGLIDDHEILIETNRPGGFTFGNFVDKLRQHRELGGWGTKEDNIARYRPGYYFFRFLETWLWQSNAHAWGRARIVIAALSLWLFCLALARFSDPLFALACSLSVTAFPCWPDVWRYLGRGEVYSALGTAVAIYGFAILWGGCAQPPMLSRSVRSFGWLAMLCGFLIAFGAKENFLFLMLPILAVYVRDLWKKTAVPILGHLTVISALAFIAVIVVILKLKLAQMGNLDVYGRSTESGHRLTFVLPALKAFFLSGQGLALLGMSGCALLVAFFRRKKPRDFRNVVVAVVLTLGLSAGLFVFQYVFYVGGLENRYRFPAEFCWFGAMVSLAYWMTATPRLRGLEMSRWKKWLWRGVSLLALAPVLILGPHRLTSETIIRVNQTQRFEEFLSRFAKVCAVDPQRPVVLEVTQIYAYEPAYAMPIMLKHFGVTNPLYLRYAPGVDLTATQSQHLYDSLIKELTAISNEGRFGYRPWPAGKDATPANPLVVNLDADKAVTPGEWHGRAPW